MKNTKKLPDDLGAMLNSMLAELPRVSVGKKMHSTNFTIGEKVFAFTKGDGVVLKLPPDTVKRLVERNAASLLAMGKRVMKEWVVIQYENPADSRKHLDLFKEAMNYVSAGPKKK